MAAISWDMSSYDTVRTAILVRAAQGLGYDFDGWYGYQCWDLGANLYWNAGRSIFKTKNSFTGAGGVDSYVQTAVLYQPAKDYNQASPFYFVSDWTQVKRGMMCVWAAGGCNGKIGITGHNAFADQDVTSPTQTITCLGQNQTGTEINPPGGHYPTLNSYFNSDGFLGAFAYSPWYGGTPPEPPEPTPSGAILPPPPQSIAILKKALQLKRKSL